MTTALITGASGGIGRGFAEELAARKSNLVLVARSEEKLNQLASQLQTQHNIKVDVIVKDLAQPGSTADVFNYTQEKGIIIDTLINNAGFGEYGEFAERDSERQVKMIQLNVLALVELTHKYLPLMQQRKSGNIINVASIAAFQPIPYMSVYAASKAFVLSFSESLWAENREYGVHVLCVCPGPIDTNFFTEARFPPTLAAKNIQVTKVETVVRDTLQALEKGETVVVSGGFTSHLIPKLSRLVPRKTLVSVIEKQFKR
ncbi:MAG: SDR family oxidoreductase [Calothrix sp. C42_A2020_038]|nr:SDR family oxidoreductase [Calothrix sp. C42_A2020_038]